MCRPLPLLWSCVLPVVLPLGPRFSVVVLPLVRLFGCLCLCCALLCVWGGPCLSALRCWPCWLLVLLICLPSPAVGPVRLPGPALTLVPPSGYLVASCNGLVALLSVGSVVVLCCPSVICLMAAKASLPCVGYLHPLHHVAGDVKALSLATLRYSSR